MTARRFELHRDTDVSGVSGTGVVAEGIEFSDGPVALRWTSAWPTSVVFHDRGMESVEAIHGHSGATRIVYLDGEEHHCVHERRAAELEDRVALLQHANESCDRHHGSAFAKDSGNSTVDLVVAIAVVLALVGFLILAFGPERDAPTSIPTPTVSTSTSLRTLPPPASRSRSPKASVSPSSRNRHGVKAPTPAPHPRKSSPRRHARAGAGSLDWHALAMCESRNQPGVVSSNGKYHGLYQFDVQTWRGQGGRGLPSKASRAEQLRRAKSLYADRGRAPWPVCGERL